MNLFTTDHPLSDDSHQRKHSALSSVLVAAVMLFPFLLFFFWLENATESGESTGYPPDPFWTVFLGAVTWSLLTSFVGVAVVRLAVCIFREVWRRPAKPCS
jgi:hypothetical protein